MSTVPVHKFFTVAYFERADFNGLISVRRVGAFTVDLAMLRAKRHAPDNATCAEISRYGYTLWRGSVR